MLFIKNYAQKSENEKFEVSMEHYGEDNVIVSLNLPGANSVPILTSTVPGLGTSIKRSIEFIGKKTASLTKEEQYMSAALLADVPTEVAFFVKDKKIALVEGKDPEAILPIVVDPVEEQNEEDDKPKKRYPRDMIVLICPKKDVQARLEYDSRNLVGAPIIATIGEEYQIILAMVKWPTWSNLKFPVYMCVSYGDDAIGAFKLGSRVENKVNKNQVEDADIETAREYLNESAKIMSEKKKQPRENQNRGEHQPRQERQQNNNGNKGANRDNNRQNNNQNRDNRSQNNHGKGGGKQQNNNGGYKGNNSVKFPVGKVPPKNVKVNNRRSGNR